MESVKLFFSKGVRARRCSLNAEFQSIQFPTNQAYGWQVELLRVPETVTVMSVTVLAPIGRVRLLWERLGKAFPRLFWPCMGTPFQQAGLFEFKKAQGGLRDLVDSEERNKIHLDLQDIQQ